MENVNEVRATASMGAFVANYLRSDLSQEELMVARLSFIDTVLSASVGASSDLGKKLLSPAASSAMIGDVRVLGTSHQANSSWAAFLFGTLAHIEELDDWAEYGPGGAPVWGALLALAQAEGLTDELTLLDAFCVGVKATYALFQAGKFSKDNRGLDGTSVFGSVASTAACARLIGLSADETISALATMASEFGGPIANRGTEAGDTYAGFAAKNGLQAASLARGGLYGAPDILEGEQGFGDATFCKSEAKLLDLNLILTEPIQISEAIRFKHSPCSIDHQRVIATLADLISQLDLSAGEPYEIGVEGVPPAIEGARFDIPSTSGQARSSLRSSMTRVVLDGSVNLDQLRNGTLASSEFANVAAKIRVGILSRWEPSLFDSKDEATNVWVSTEGRGVVSADPRNRPLTLSPNDLVEKWKSVAASESPEISSNAWLTQTVIRWEELSNKSSPYDATEVVGLRS